MSKVYDALKERLPNNWSLTRTDGPSSIDGTHSNYYRWTRWSDGEQMLVEVHEAYAEQIGNVDKLCDHLVEGVYEAFGEPTAKYMTPLYRATVLTNQQMVQ